MYVFFPQLQLSLECVCFIWSPVLDLSLIGSGLSQGPHSLPQPPSASLTPLSVAQGLEL